MLEKLTYRKATSFKWLFTLSVVFSLFAFPGVVSTAEACRPLEQRIEVVTSGEEHSQISFGTWQITVSEFSSCTSGRAKEYEYLAQIAYQRQVKVTLDTVSEQLYSCSPPDLFWIARVTSSLSDDIPPLPSG